MMGVLDLSGGSTGETSSYILIKQGGGKAKSENDRHKLQILI